MKDHYDVGVVGCWWGANYGSVLNGYAVYKTLKSLGLSVLMIHKHNALENDWEIFNTHSEKFVKTFYPEDEVSPIIPFDKLKELNSKCDMFLTGSDQIWNYGINKTFDFVFMLNFADDSKKKISFGTSFGHSKDGTPADQLPKIRNLIRRYDAVSLREKSGVDICRDVYGINAQEVVEPVFCMTRQEYIEIAEKSELNIETPYIVTYILDPTPAKREAIQYYEKISGMKAINVLDGDPRVYDRNKDILNLPNTMGKIGAEDLMKLYSNASLVITDSFHGTAFAIIFNKPFLSVCNLRRGSVRFVELLNKFDLSDRLASDPDNIPKDIRFFDTIDYSKINKTIEAERKASISWLQYVISTPKKKLPDIKLPIPKPAEIPVDVRRCQMTVSLLASYKIRHIVISSGTRHIELVRFFENNDCFEVHRVVDERSAGFYAIGLAEKLQEPVVCCCTSGTASSNYLSSASEAFYQHLPIIYITADRYPYLLNQREEQMVPQENMYGDVVLKSVTLPIKDDFENFSAARRLVCEAITESTHRWSGPVHINIPVKTFNRYTPANEAEYYDLRNCHYDPIRLYSLHKNEEAWEEAAKRLQRSKVLIVYGQSHSLSDSDINIINKFSKSLNCVIATDILSNIKAEKTVSTYIMMREVSSSKEMAAELKPDIVITMFGSNVSQIRGYVSNAGRYAHWDIAPHGKFADPYNRLTRVFECDPIQFCQKMTQIIGDQTTNDSYYQTWKKYEVLSDPIPKEYSQKYAVGKLFEDIPAGSLVHLGNSNTIRMAASYSLNSRIEVFCNRGTNGIDGSTSAFMGQVSVSNELCFLLVGDLSFFYDMNSLWNKNLKGNVRIMLFNNWGAGLLRHLKSASITYKHNATAEGWVKSLGFTYISSHNKEEFDANIKRFTSDEDTPMFFEVFC